MRGDPDSKRHRAPSRSGEDIVRGPASGSLASTGYLGHAEMAAIGLSLLAVCVMLVDPLVISAVRDLEEGPRQFFRGFTDLAKARWPLMLAACGLAVLYLLGPQADSRRADAARRQAAGMLGFLIAAVALSGLAASLVKNVLGRARPKFFDELGSIAFRPFSFDYDFASFPSGHATSIFAVAAVLAIFWPRARRVLFLAAAWIGATRFLIGSHYLSDVAAGALFGVASTYYLRDRLAARGILFRRLPGGGVELRARRIMQWAVGRAKSSFLVRPGEARHSGNSSP